MGSILEVAARNELLKSAGHHAAREFFGNLEGALLGRSAVERRVGRARHPVAPPAAPAGAARRRTRRRSRAAGPPAPMPPAARPESELGVGSRPSGEPRGRE